MNLQLKEWKLFFWKFKHSWLVWHMFQLKNTNMVESHCAGFWLHCRLSIQINTRKKWIRNCPAVSTQFSWQCMFSICKKNKHPGSKTNSEVTSVESHTFTICGGCLVSTSSWAHKWCLCPTATANKDTKNVNIFWKQGEKNQELLTKCGFVATKVF